MTVGSYSEATKLANGSCVKSALVHVGGHSWRVVFYPNAGGSPAHRVHVPLPPDGRR